MKIVALISGGKDSCYNMMQCVAAGHEIVALANLEPCTKDELDSYMYQSVAHEGVALMGEAMGLPLYRKKTSGKAQQINKDYVPTESDEVEDLYELLQNVKAEMLIEGVAVGAILSDYQRIRVENVCNRLGLVSLTYLWQRDQVELLQEMIDCNVEAIVVKVATLGLERKHLNKSIKELQPHLLCMKEKYGLNVCGEGGEYETFTLDCPLYTHTIVLDDYKCVDNSNNPIAPVVYMQLNQLHLIPKSITNLPLKDRLSNLFIKDADGYITDHCEEVTEDEVLTDGSLEELSNEKDCTPESNNTQRPVTCSLSNSGWMWCGNLAGYGTNSEECMIQALNKLENCLNSADLSILDVCSINMFINDMNQYPLLNKVYCRIFSHINPPTRVCIEVPLPTNCHVVLEALAWKSKLTSQDVCADKHTMHVQGISHWAPANIGPYSQAIRVDDIICLAGQIGLVPGSMKLVKGGIKQQCQLTLRSLGRIVKAIDQNTQLRDVVQGLCYVTNSKYIEFARKQWEEKTNNAIVDYIVVSKLPRDALVEWHVWAHRFNNVFEYEETGKCVEDYSISIRRRWNYDLYDNLSAIVCHVANTEISTGVLECKLFTEVILYTLTKLNQNNESEGSVSYLRIFYPVGKNLNINMMYSVLTDVRQQYNVVYTIVPVVSLENKSILLSICGVRY